MKFRFFLFFAALLWPGLAAAGTYVIDKNHTSLLFFVEHAGFSKMVGEFNELEGEFTFDKDHPENSSAIVTIKTASVDTDVPNLNQKLVESGYFDVATYPVATFKSTAVKVTGKNTADVTGDLSLLGVTKPITLNVTFNKAGRDIFSFGQKRAGFSAKGHLFRSAFGMMASLPAVGDRVDILIEVEGLAK